MCWKNRKRTKAGKRERWREWKKEGRKETGKEGESDVFVFKTFLKGSKKAKAFQEHERQAGPGRLGGGRWRVKPPPRRLVWKFWEMWRV